MSRQGGYVSGLGGDAAVSEIQVGGPGDGSSAGAVGGICASV